jgi:arylamine N-acetyltransferase
MYMACDPLAQPPRDSAVTRAFLRFFGLARREPDAAYLETIARAFSRIPYENLTKIIKYREAGDPIRSRRDPPEVLGDHVRWRSGGTCFSLTALLLHLVRSLGYEAEPVLADRRYGPNTHCAALVTLDGKTHLLDPGYLILRPVPLEADEVTRVATPFNEIVLTPESGGSRLALSTSQQGSDAYRLTFKLPGADPAEFMRAWHESFSWDMMRYPLLTWCRDGKQLYLQDTHFQERDRACVDRRALAFERLPRLIADEFGLAPDVVLRALEIVKRRERSHE